MSMAAAEMRERIRLFDENTGGELLLRLAQRDPLPQWLLTGVSSREKSSKYTPSPATVSATWVGLGLTAL